MVAIPVQFACYTGLKRNIFQNVRLVGSWDINGRYSDQWTSRSMEQIQAEDGCPCFKATVQFDETQVGQIFSWGVFLDGPQGTNLWGIPTEVNDHLSTVRHRIFILQPTSDSNIQQESYFLTHCRRLGANKHYLPGRNQPGVRFAVWAPNAEKVEVVFGNRASGYIADNGFGINEDFPTVPMFKKQGGIWETDEAVSPVLTDFSRFDHVPYMFRIWKKGENTNRLEDASYRTDIYSRCQIGSGDFDPQGARYTGNITDLDGTKSCSVIIDPETVTRNFREVVWPERDFISGEEFWANEFTPGTGVPNRVEDLVIYELHVGSIWNNTENAGNLGDAIGLLDYLKDLGINTIELLPMSEYRGSIRWGYATSHYFAIEYSTGGRDQLKHFIRECHRRGMAVIMDVVYNHYHHEAERAEWAYDSDNPEENIYYWYERQPSDYPTADGGYIDNWSTGYAPRYYEEIVRKMFISSAVALVEDFHVDGFRVDQTTSIHLYNAIHSNGAQASNVNIFGAKFLREYSRTLKLIKPTVMLMAEDHSDWDKVTESPDAGGLGFDATWYANFYHHLIGDTGRGPDYANLLKTAGYGHDEPLAMDYFAGALGSSGHKKVVYHESHDEAGNSEFSQRTIVVAVNSAPLLGETRRYAEARARFCASMSMLSAGTPLFLMGEEIGAEKIFTYDNFINNRENFRVKRQGDGGYLFKFYQDLIQLRLGHRGLRSHEFDIMHVHDTNRVISFLRWDGNEMLLIVASLNNRPFASGYFIENSRLGDRAWREVFNSDAEIYGGNNTGNLGMTIFSNNGRINVVIPSNGVVVFLS